jgi:hypothetical protein
MRHIYKAAALWGVPKRTRMHLDTSELLKKVEIGMTFPQLKKWLGAKTNDATLSFVHARQEEANLFREMPVMLKP